MLSPGLVVASLLLAISAIWLVAAIPRGPLGPGPRHREGSDPVQNLALANIGIQQIRGDAVLNVISRSGNASFQDDFLATSKKVGPGTGSVARRRGRPAQEAGGQGAALIATAERDATAWYAANNQVYRLGSAIAANYAGERNLVVGWTNASTAAGYTTLGGRSHQGHRRRPGQFSTPPPPTERTPSTP